MDLFIFTLAWPISLENDRVKAYIKKNMDIIMAIAGII
jgi:hypothetical protein